MNRNGSIVFGSLFNVASEIFKKIRSLAISPEESKTLREWGITEATEMVGRTPQLLRKYEELNKIPKARLRGKGKKEERVYNLKEINFLRDFFGTRKHKPKDVPPAIISSANFKGGGAKTITATLAAQYLALQGYKVLFIDCDSQGSATHMFGYIPDEHFTREQTILDVLTGKNNDIPTLINKTYWDGLDLIPANLGLYNAELMVPSEAAKHYQETGEHLEFYNRLNRALVKVYDKYDVIILDCPPSMGVISINAIFSANALIVTMPPVMVDFASTIQFFKMVSEVLERLPNKEYAFIRILITKFNSRKSASEIKALVKKHLGPYLMQNHMFETEVISKAAGEMQTLYEIEKYLGDKKTFERALRQANLVNEEIQDLIEEMWGKTTAIEMDINSEQELILNE